MQVISEIVDILLFCYQINNIMKITEVFSSTLLLLIVVILLLLASCSPMVMTTGAGEPLPPWFYPNRLEVVRYVYFPEYSFYYDLSTFTYLYLDDGVRVGHQVLPTRYRNLDLRRTRYERVKGYRNDNIRQYHEENNVNIRVTSILLEVIETPQDEVVKIITL